MTKELFVALDISNPNITKAFQEHTKSLPGVKVVQLSNFNSGTSKSPDSEYPDIIILDDNQQSGNLFTRIKTTSSNFTQAAIFVVSSNKDPQQIIDAMKAGAAEYLVEPIEEKTLHNAIEEVRAKMANSGKLAQGSVYSFISSKGGVGATTLAVNTAAALANGKKKAVALLDMCFQSGDASVLLDIVPQTTIMDICESIHRLDVSFLRGAMTSHNTGLSFLAAPQDPEDSEDITASHVSSIIDLSKMLFDYVVLDCASMHINECTMEAFKRSDKVFVVADMSVPSIRNTVRICKLIQKLGIDLNKVEIIINRFIKGGALSLKEIEKNFGKPVYWLVPNDFSDIVSSINRGIPLVKMQANAPFSKNINTLTQKILNQLEEPDFRGIRGTFGKVL
jgi:pilus assembly protein CpaE